MSTGFRFSIDRGGTFTDIHVQCPGGKERVMKLLSVDPDNYADAPREGIRRILEQELGRKISANEPLETSEIEYIRMGTTVATNALLERKGEKTALLITEGFRDLLHIGNQSRPKIFDLKIEIPGVLYSEVVEVGERVILQQDRCQLDINAPVVEGTTMEKLHVVKELNETKLRNSLKLILSKGIDSLAVVLMHSYTYPHHELRVGKIADDMGFKQVSLSHIVMPMVKIVPRGFTACVDAYLTPCIKEYLNGFQSGFDENLRNIQLLFMQSDGGLTPVQKFNGSRAILSGPAGGVVGYAKTSFKDQAVIGFDMGGTSTDVSRYAGDYEHVFEATTAGVTIQAPQLDINTVAAGGGSRLFFRHGMFAVGPDSAGAHPGPACYRKGGPLTVTDANLCLGRLLPEYFPKIFGPDENEALDINASKKLLNRIADEVNSFARQEKSDAKPSTAMEVAMGFIDVANEAMCRPIRALTEGKGHDTSRHILSCFGGAGGQHACAIARKLGMKKVFIHKYSGILSAYGMALADVVQEAQESSACSYSQENVAWIENKLSILAQKCQAQLKIQGFTVDQINTEVYLNLRYKGTDCALMCSPSAITKDSLVQSKYGDFLAVFQQRYKTEFGFTIPNRCIMVDDVRVRCTGGNQIKKDHIEPVATIKPPKVEKVVKCYFSGYQYMETNAYLFEDLSYGHALAGPAIVIDRNSTILVEPDCCATITNKGDIEIQIEGGKSADVTTKLDSIQLSIFSHRFMSIAEQMGRILQRTSISTNIKERLDFSCALFGPDGGLVSNAPHIPVHLGAMQEAVQYQIKMLGNNLNEGDCILSNHPKAGGSHLPDLTVITPVFTPGQPKPIFFLANRGHHADIGGTTPGSMPPHSTSIQQEGAVFKTFKLVEAGIFQEEEVTKALMEPGKLPGCSGTRNLHDNLADLRAQVAANHRGIQLVTELVTMYGLEVVQAYMMHIQHTAEKAVEGLLRQVAADHGGSDDSIVSLKAADKMDDGSVIKLTVNIDKGKATFDFSGTSPMTLNNLNCPRAVTLSAIIYSLRCMCQYEVPLNQGCLAPVTIRIPEFSILDPEEGAAVVGGNVLTSQRIVDVIMKAFGACAASQGCMNNITFGDDEVGYYETVAGGGGAGPGWQGRSGVHSHMTNTRITDPEILERRYTVVLRKFQLNPGTGGQGEFPGGDGVVREIEFRKDMVLSVLCERRVFPPYGLAGGGDGSLGRNSLLRRGGPLINMGGKNSVDVWPGDIFRLESPGGGGYGLPSDSGMPVAKRPRTEATFTPRGSAFDYTSRQEAH